MRKTFASTVAAGLLALTCTAAFGADLPRKAAALPPPPPPSPWDIAFGGGIASDYNFRGVSQSNRGPSASAYFEPQYKTAVGTFYVGVAAISIDWPSIVPDFGFTNPAAEVDIYGGWRNSWGAFSLDIGGWYYWYPKEIFNGFTDKSDFVEVYAKLGYDFGSGFTVGANVFYTPDLLHYSTTFNSLLNPFGLSASKVDATYASGTAKWVLPWTTGDLGAFVSGELGHWWIDDSNWAAYNLAAGATYTNPSYTYWNAGLAFTYKVLTLDFRYHGTDQSTADCASFLVSTVPNGSNKWCGDAYIVSAKFDTTLSAFK